MNFSNVHSYGTYLTSRSWRHTFPTRTRRLTNSRMVLFGRSLGGAVAISLAQRLPALVSAVVVENTFLSVGDMVDVLMPFLKHIRRFVLRMNWDSHLKIAELKVPIMFIAG